MNALARHDWFRVQSGAPSKPNPATQPPLITFATPASTIWIDPGGNFGAVPPTPHPRVELTDGTTTVNTNLVTLSLDGTNLTTTITKNGAITLVTAQAPLLVTGSAHTNTLIYTNSAGNTYSNFWRFVVGAYSTLPAAYSVASVDTSKPGFKAKVQMMNQAVNRHPIAYLPSGSSAWPILAWAEASFGFSWRTLSL